jgi:hypothetical protein
MNSGDTSDRIIYVALTIASLFGILAFFRVPAYEKGAWAVIGLAVLVVTNVMSFKFGVHQIQPPAGTNQITQTVVPPDPNPQSAATPPGATK